MSRWKGAFSLVTYTSDDGSVSQQVWNPRDGVLPQVITLPGGKQGTISATVFKGPGWTPPTGTVTVGDVPPPPAPAPGAAQTTLGWPGQPYLSGG